MISTALQASWRETPRAAWVIGCAYGRGWPWASRATSVLTWPLLAALLLPAAAHRQLARQHRNAYLLLELPGRRTAVRALVQALLVLIAGLVLASALTVIGAGTALLAMALGLGATAAQALSYVVLGFGCLSLVGAMALTFLAGAGRARELSQVVRSGRACPAATWPPIVLAMFGAWPMYDRHGVRLLEAILPDWDASSAPVLGVARDADVAGWYQRHGGFRLLEPGSLIIVRCPPTCDHS